MQLRGNMRNRLPLPSKTAHSTDFEDVTIAFFQRWTQPLPIANNLRNLQAQ